jgi:hypothetical protein
MRYALKYIISIENRCCMNDGFEKFSYSSSSTHHYWIQNSYLLSIVNNLSESILSLILHGLRDRVYWRILKFYFSCQKMVRMYHLKRCSSIIEYVYYSIWKSIKLDIYRSVLHLFIMQCNVPTVSKLIKGS